MKPFQATRMQRRHSQGRGRRQWLGLEKEWDESRWDFYLRFWRHLVCWKRLSSDSDSGKGKTEGEAEGEQRRQCLRKVCRAYKAYYKRFECR